MSGDIIVVSCTTVLSIQTWDTTAPTTHPCPRAFRNLSSPGAETEPGPDVRLIHVILIRLQDRFIIFDI